MSNLSIKEKKYFIYNNINKIDNTEILFNFIKQNNINYSQNANGIHINISAMNDHIIILFYDELIKQFQSIKQQSEFIDEYNEAVDLINKTEVKEIKTNKNTLFKQLKLTDIQNDIIKSIK